MKRMKQMQMKFSKRGGASGDPRDTILQMVGTPPRLEPAKESPNVAKAKHMKFVNMNVERAFDVTTREGFDFRNTRNQFLHHTSKGSIF